MTEHSDGESNEAPGRRPRPRTEHPGLALDILVVDDEPRIRTTLGLCLRGDGHYVEAVGTVDEAIHAVERRSFDLAFVDLRLPDGSGEELISRFVQSVPAIKVVVITAHASVESAVEAMRRGATDYLPKPFSTSEVRLVTRRVSEVRALEHGIEVLATQVSEDRPPLLLDSKSPVMSRALALAREVAESDVTVLIRGESGTGKGILARAIHLWSPRNERPFAIAHCPSFPSELLESELFGHAKGAFTGAVANNPGRVARCEGGTLFLDEIGDLPERLQPKLLRFLESREYERLGDPVTRKADVRIMTATNRDLEAAVAEGKFREDLYYRIRVIEIEIPPLRDRPADILPLADLFLLHYARKYARPVEGFARDAEAALAAHSWPGNVRELENMVERAVILSRGALIGAATLVPEARRALEPPHPGACVTLAELEEEHIRRIVARAATLEEAADILGIDTTTLWRRRKQYGI